MPKYEKYPNESQEEANIRISKNIENTGLPSIDARDRLQTSPDVSASKTWKDVRKAAKKAGHSDTYGKPTAKKIALHTTDILEHGHRGNVGEIVKTIEKSKKRKKKK